jgi:hypothetical protein
MMLAERTPLPHSHPSLGIIAEYLGPDLDRDLGRKDNKLEAWDFQVELGHYFLDLTIDEAGNPTSQLTKSKDLGLSSFWRRLVLPKYSQNEGAIQ